MTGNAPTHTCSYFCDKPECIKAQRDELREKLAAIRSQPDTVAVPIDALVALRSRDVMTRVMIDKHGVSISGWHVPQPAFSQFVPPAIFNILEPYDDHGGSVKAALTRAIQRAAQEAK